MTATMAEHWQRVEEALPSAVSITWDGCHKIYVHMDEETHRDSVDCGYDCIEVRGDTDEALATLRQWFGESCPLRFIQSIRTVAGDRNEGYESLIPQGAEDGEDW